MTGRPAKPTTPLTTTSASRAMAARASGPAEHLGAGRAAGPRSSAARDASAMATTLGAAARAACAASRSTDAAGAEGDDLGSGRARPRTTSRVWVPIDPVEPDDG